jgi:hypothetical protein
MSRLDRQQFLFTRRATVVFGVAAVLSLGAVIMMHIDLILDPLSRLNRAAHLAAGVAAAVGFVSLLVGMCSFWLNYDISSKLNRTVWFVVLLLGAPYGSQIAYYAFVYLPAVEKRLRNPLTEALETPPSQMWSWRRAIGPLGWVLLVGWALFSVTVAACLENPIRMYHLLRPFAAILSWWPVVMFVITIPYAIGSAFLIGIRRPAGSSLADPLKNT